jgi:hypothetical protein
MKVDLIETVDRYNHFMTQKDKISDGVDGCIRNRPKAFENYPFYIFAHKRTVESDERIALFNQHLTDWILNPSNPRQWHKIEDVPTSRMIWSVRLTKPEPQENSMLFKAYPPGDTIKIFWIIPAQSEWDQYTKGNLTESSIVYESIQKFRDNPRELLKGEKDDLPKEKIKDIYRNIALYEYRKR